MACWVRNHGHWNSNRCRAADEAGGRADNIGSYPPTLCIAVSCHHRIALDQQTDRLQGAAAAGIQLTAAPLAVNTAHQFTLAMLGIERNQTMA